MKVFYDPRQTAKANVSFSPSAQKPARVVADWQQLGFNVELMPVVPATEADLALAHHPMYVSAVLKCAMNNGFGNRMPEVAESLPWTSGSFITAALHAWQNKETVASPTSGFHHACYESGGGFCTFNGLMVAFHKLRQAGCTGRIGILDLDMHYGNGTVNILRETKCEAYTHYTFGLESEHSPGTVSWASDWLGRLPGILQEFSDCEVVLYQAGADPHFNDPFGGALSTEDMLNRDRLVFSYFHQKKIPMAWNLAGGYQEPFSAVLEIHANTARVHQTVHEGKIYWKGFRLFTKEGSIEKAREESRGDQ